MPAPLVADDLWAIIEPLFPPEPPKLRGGRPRIQNRATLSGILFVLRSGIPWEMLPLEMGCGSGVTCWRRLREWQAAGLWERLHRHLLETLHQAGMIDWSRAALDSASIPAKKRLSWLSSVVLVFDDLTRRVPAQGWRAAPPPWAAAPLTDPAPCQLSF